MELADQHTFDAVRSAPEAAPLPECVGSTREAPGSVAASSQRISIAVPGQSAAADFSLPELSAAMAAKRQRLNEQERGVTLDASLYKGCCPCADRRLDQLLARRCEANIRAAFCGAEWQFEGPFFPESPVRIDAQEDLPIGERSPLLEVDDHLG